mmetsp:Transcript_6929/g.9703  ORF Transcript_6929/g.9703 Transcript_6929/m.9703 type:complete len:263 (+) Transcript_6929:359-1147(+)
MTSPKKNSRDCTKLGLGQNCSLTTTNPLRIVGWLPIGDTAFDVRSQCAMRHTGPGTALSFLWDRGGEFFIRDPKLAKQVWKLNATKKLYSFNTSSLRPGQKPPRWYSTLAQPCPEATSHEKACLGAHLWIPPLRQACARYAITDMPAALRSALLVFDMAPSAGKFTPPLHASPELWPFDPPPLPDFASHAASLSLPPKCLELSNIPRYTPTQSTSSFLLSSSSIGSGMNISNSDTTSHDALTSSQVSTTSSRSTSKLRRHAM